MYDVFSNVELLEEITVDGVTMPRGSVGTILDVYMTPEPAYEVEFADADGRVVFETALYPRQVTFHQRTARADGP